MFPYVIILKLKDNKPIKFIECEWLKFVKNMKDHIKKLARGKKIFKIII